MRYLVSLLMVTVGMNGLTGRAGEWDYPSTRAVEQTDEFFGQPVVDPYRWLEDDARTSPDVEDWIRRQNELTMGYLQQLPRREAIQRRLTELWDHESYGIPRQVGKRYVYFYNTGLQNQDVLYVMDGWGAEPRVLIDPNSWSNDGTIALSGIVPSHDGRYLAYGVAEAGSDWNTWRVLDMETGQPLSDELKWIKFGEVAWSADHRGFFYGRYREPEPGQQFQSVNLGMQVYYHQIGAPQSDDKLIHEDPEHPEWGFMLDATRDGHYLILTVWKGTDDKYRVLYRDLRQPESPLVTLIDGFDHEYTFLGNVDSTFYFRSDRDAPRRCVVAIDVNQSNSTPRVVIPEGPHVLSGVSMLKDHFICSYLQDAHSLITVCKWSGEPVRNIELPGLGTVTGFRGETDDVETFFAFASYVTPPRIYRYDVETGQQELFRETKVAARVDDFEVRQVFVPSKDGTRIPMFLVHRRGLKLDGSHPTLLYGYGGFAISLTPNFSLSALTWVEMGGVYAVANLRGGGEYGEEWHKAGTKLNKQNVFDDFIAASEWLIANHYTSPAKLGIQGGSNGGLLVGACMTQRPDLFGACLPAVGVMDMLRFHRFTAGRFWVDDYGSAESSPEEFRALLAYSPYHNLRPGTRYPATLVTTADTDDRVVPGHSFKFAARLQQCQAGSAPVMIRIETRAGHGAGKPTAKRIEEIADQLAFLAQQLGL